MTQNESVFFPKREYTVIMSNGAFHGDTRFTGDDTLLEVIKGSTEVLTFNIREIVDNKSEPLDISGLTVRFRGWEYLTSQEYADGDTQNTISKVATIINAVQGTVQVLLLAADTAVEGLYRCHLTISNAGGVRYNPSNFTMEILDPTAP